MLGELVTLYLRVYLTNTSLTLATIENYSLLLLAVMAGGMITTGNYRYFRLYPGKVRDMSLNSAICPLRLYPRFLPIFCCYQVLIILQYHNTKGTGCEHRVGTTYQYYHILFIPYIFVLGCLLLTTLLLLTLVFIVLLIFLKKTISAFLKFNAWRSLIMSAIVQIIITLLFCFLSFFFLVFRCLTEYITTLYLILLYRRYIVENSI